jgi:hypothetical protein
LYVAVVGVVLGEIENQMYMMLDIVVSTAGMVLPDTPFNKNVFLS